jgi:hypothetical protein
MEDLVRASDLTEAMTNLKAMSAKLVAAVEDVGLWKVDISYEVVPSTLDFKITVKKGNGNGFIKTVPFADTKYYENDPDSLAEQLIDDILDKLYKPQLRQAIQAPMTRAVKNICLMAEKK